MALKPLAHKSPTPLPAAPEWGTLAPEGHAPGVLRLEVSDRTESLPYHTLTRWTLLRGGNDVLTIRAGGLVVTVRGRDLLPAVDALDEGRLVSLRAVEDRYLPVKTGTVVTTISIAEAES